MSYIRALSNPEAMYAYGGRDGITSISANTCIDREGNHYSLAIPSHVFRGLFQKWAREGYPEEVSFHGATLREIPSRRQEIKTLLRRRTSPPNAYQWRLTYKKWGKKSIVAYKVTWYYVASNIVERDAFR